MGDISDYYIDQAIFGKSNHHRRTHMDENVMCKRCGARGLRWQQVHTQEGENYALFTRSGSHHECARVDEEFEDLTGESNE